MGDDDEDYGFATVKARRGRAYTMLALVRRVRARTMCTLCLSPSDHFHFSFSLCILFSRSSIAELRPLVVFLKLLLKEHALNEVFTGGLSSYGIFHLVLSFLVEILKRSAFLNTAMTLEDQTDF